MAVTNARLNKASEAIVTAIRDRIIFGRLPIGSPLPSEAELMEEFGLGRVTVRESLRLLERDGIVNIKRGPGGGVTVGRPDVQRMSELVTVVLALNETKLSDFVSVRWLLEPEAARLAALNATAEQRAQLREAVDNEGSFGNTVDLHNLIAEISGNVVLGVVFSAMHDAFLNQHRDRFVRPIDTEGTLRAHQRIASHIIAGESDQAEAAMRRHLQAYEARMREIGVMDDIFIPRPSS